MLGFQRVGERLRSRLRSRVNKKVDSILSVAGQAAILAARANSESFVDLWDAEVKVFSQWGEDGILSYMCDVLGISKPRMLEIGVGDFRECNSRLLAEIRSASVYAVDSDSSAAQVIRSMSVGWKTTIVFENLHVTPVNVKSVVTRARALLSGLDVVSLDIDGNDYWVLQEMDLAGVRIAVVEYNPLFGPLRSLTVQRDDDFSRFKAHNSGQLWGASLRAVIDVMVTKGFLFVGTNRAGNNAMFISKEDQQVWKMPLPPLGDLSRYTDWRVQDVRDSRGEMLPPSGDDYRQLLNGITVWEVDQSREVSLRFTSGELELE